MNIVVRWILPVAMTAIGIGVWTGLLFPEFPAGFGLRPMTGFVLILFGIHRWAASRSGVSSTDRRRFGGDRPRPWEKDEE